MMPKKSRQETTLLKEAKEEAEASKDGGRMVPHQNISFTLAMPGAFFRSSF
jgi:hypothetical protein